MRAQMWRTPTFPAPPSLTAFPRPASIVQCANFLYRAPELQRRSAFRLGSGGRRIFRMLSRTSAFVLSTAVGLLLGTAQAQVPSSFRPPLAVLRSSNAGGSISDAHALQALWYAAAEMKIAADNIPRILVIHSGRDLAVAGGWPWPTKYPNSGAVLIEPTADGQKVYYLCLLGPP